MSKQQKTAPAPTLANLTVEEWTDTIISVNQAMIDAEVLVARTRLQINECALLLGQAFTALKEKLPHGEFAEYCRSHFTQIGPRQRQRYMLLADVEQDLELIDPYWKANVAWTEMLRRRESNSLQPDPMEAVQGVSRETLRSPLNSDASGDSMATTGDDNSLPATEPEPQDPQQSPKEEPRTSEGLPANANEASSIPERSLSPAQRQNKSRPQQRRLGAPKRRAKVDDVTKTVGHLGTSIFKNACKLVCKSTDRALLEHSISQLQKAESLLAKQRAAMEERLKALDHSTKLRKRKPR